MDKLEQAVIDAAIDHIITFDNYMFLKNNPIRQLNGYEEALAKALEARETFRQSVCNLLDYRKAIRDKK